MSAAQIAEQQQHNTQNLPTPHRHTAALHWRYIYQPTMLFFPREIRSVLSGIQQLRASDRRCACVCDRGFVGRKTGNGYSRVIGYSRSWWPHFAPGRRRWTDDARELDKDGREPKAAWYDLFVVTFVWKCIIQTLSRNRIGEFSKMELPPRLWKKDTHTYTVTANLPPQKEGPQLIIMIIRKRERTSKKGARARSIPQILWSPR